MEGTGGGGCRFRPTRRLARTAVRPPVPLEQDAADPTSCSSGLNLLDPAVEEALYDSLAMRAFAGIDLSTKRSRTKITVCKFRHLLERNKLGKVLLTAVNEHLRRGGIKIAKEHDRGRDDQAIRNLNWPLPED